MKRQILERTIYQLFNYPDKSVKFRIKNELKKALKRGYTLNNPMNWPNGLLMKGLTDAYENLGEDDTDRSEIIAKLRQYVDDNLKWAEKTDIPDLVISGETYLFMYKNSGEYKYKAAADTLYDYLCNKASKAQDGSVIYRDKRDSDIVLADMLGMVCPFLVKYALCFDNKEAKELAKRQIINYINTAMDEKTSLPYHGYSLRKGLNYGIVGWGRATGWLLLAEASYLCGFSKDNDNNDEEYQLIFNSYMSIIRVLGDYMKNNGQLSWHILSKEDHADSSAMAMIFEAMSIYRTDEADRLLQKGIVALEALVKDGNVVSSSKECIDFGMYPQEYGVYPWAQGPALSVLALNSRL